MLDTGKPEISADSGQNGKKYLIFLGSSTPEKLRDYQHICEQKRLPVYFRDIKELLAAFKSSQEKTGKYRGNLLDKLQKVQGSIIEMLPNSEEVLAAKCKDYNIPYDASRIYFATEDGGVSLPAPIWKAVNKEGIPRDVLENIEKKSSHCGPDVELAPVLSAVLGAQNLMQRVTHAARSLGFGPKSQIQVTEKTFLSLTPFKGESSRPELIAKGETTNYLYEPGDLSSERRRISTLDYVRTKDVLDKSCAQLGSEYVARFSARSKTVDDLAEKLGIGALERNAAPLQTAPVDPYMIGILPEHTLPHYGHVHNFLKKKNGLAAHFAVHYPDRSHWLAPDIPSTEKEFSRQVLGGIEDVIKGSDGFLLLPDSVAGADKERQFEKLHTLFSLIVAKQLVARDMQKPIVILNHDGSWDDAIHNHLALVNQGMSKDYNLSWPDKVEGLPKTTTIDSNSYFDVVRAANYDDSLHAALLIMNKKRERYMRRPQLDDREFEGGIAPNASVGWEQGHTVNDMFKVAFFCSATNENTRLNENVEKLSYQLARHNFGIVYGGGDQHTMGAVLQGVAKRRKELMSPSLGMSEGDARLAAYIAGYSTAPILISETEKGQFSPELSYYKQTRNIYDRMAEMLSHSDAVVIAPGGAGTLQEWVAPLLIKKYAKEDYGQKPIVIYNPELFDHAANRSGAGKVWDTALKSLLGQDYDLLVKLPADPAGREKRERRCRELGVYVEADVSSVQRRLLTIRKQMEKTDVYRQRKEELGWQHAVSNQGQASGSGRAALEMS